MKIEIDNADVDYVESALADALRQGADAYNNGERHPQKMNALQSALKALGRPYVVEWSVQQQKVVVFKDLAAEAAGADDGTDKAHRP